MLKSNLSQPKSTRKMGIQSAIKSSIKQLKLTKNKFSFKRLSFVLLLLVGVALPSGVAYSEHVYQSLLKSRSALLRQRDDLKRSIYSTKSQIRTMNQKLYTLESYLYQTEKDLADVEAALRGG